MHVDIAWPDDDLSEIDRGQCLQDEGVFCRYRIDSGAERAQRGAKLAGACGCW